MVEKLNTKSKFPHNAQLKYKKLQKRLMRSS